MEEKNLRKKVIKYTVVLALISAVIIGCSAIVVVAVRKAEERSYTAYVDSLVNEYRLRFEERMASAFETLQLMGELMEDGLLSKESIVTDQIQNLSENSSFFEFKAFNSATCLLSPTISRCFFSKSEKETDDFLIIKNTRPAPTNKPAKNKTISITSP